MTGRRVVVRRGGSPATRWETATGPADGRLRSLVDPYAGYWERSARPVVRREVPVPRVMVIIGLGDALTVSPGGDPSSRGRLSSFAAGIGRDPIIVAHDGTQHCVELSMTPLGAYQLLGVPMSQIAGRVVDLADLWGRPATDLAEQLAEASTWDARFDLLDDALLRAADTGPRPGAELAGAWERLWRKHGNLPISTLLADTGWSRRRLAERFREQLGGTPKGIARVLRFAKAVDLIGGPENHPLASVATACGFYDQAHLNRDFRDLAGCTPTEYRSARLLPDLVGVGAEPRTPRPT